MKHGDNVLIWGASGGLGVVRHPVALAGGATPVCVVSSPEKADICRRDGRRAGHRPLRARATGSGRTSSTQDPREWKRFGTTIRELTGGEDVDIVFEHPGRETFGASVYVARKGGTIVTCASTCGFMHEYDNRYLWMNLKRIIGSHFANYREAWEANRPDRARADPPDAVPDATRSRSRARPPRRPPQPPPGQGRRALLWRRRGPGRPRPGPAAAPPGRDQPVPRRLSGPQRRQRWTTSGGHAVGTAASRSVGPPWH